MHGLVHFHSAFMAIFLLGAAWVTYVQAGPPVNFDQHVRPIFNKHCVACHGGVKQAAEMSFIYPDAFASTLQPGNAEASYLIERVTDPDKASRMPPADHGPALTEAEIETLKDWINAGAEWQPHWAYRPPERHAAPKVKNAGWCRQPIDSFVLAKLEANRIDPAPGAQPERWLRRVSLDLTGLPPTPEQRRTFLDEVAVDKESAYASAVDRLLDSERFGERWASVWFDLVRYADSHGLGTDRNRSVWPYRDWVIRAFNADMPYDQFTVRQIAGDLLPKATIDDHLATTVHRLTQTNEEGGTDDEEFRIAAVLDRVRTVWQTWQGTSFGCIQCHSHPYDPIEHEEFYRFAAMFNNTTDTDTGDDWPWAPVPNRFEDVARASALWRKVRSLKQRLWRAEFKAAHAPENWTPARGYTVNGNANVSVESVAGEQQFYLDDNPREGFSFSIDLLTPQSGATISGVRLHVLPLNPGTALPDSEWGFVLKNLRIERIPLRDKTQTLDENGNPISKKPTPEPISIAHVVGDEPEPRFAPEQSLNKSNQGFSAFTRIHHRRRVAFVFSEPVSFLAGERLRLRLKTHINHAGTHPLIIKRGSIELANSAAIAQTLDSPPFQDARAALSAAETELNAIEATRTPVLRERPRHLARPTHQFIRGLFLTKGKRVAPGIPTNLAIDGIDVTDRLSLARWMIHRNNPLTARVAVNRFWARLFGTGLVATEEDFGSAGDKPSHAELLDDLAVRFQEDHQWSVKQLLRELVLSATYRQSARHRSDVDRRYARLLPNGPRGTLDAEIIRDQALAVSGLLSTRMYGPPTHPPLPAGVWTPFDGNEKWPTPERGDEQRYRRSIYTLVKRSVPFPLQATFDAPSREFCTPRRLRSNTPLQPLMTLNDESFVECAEALAGRIEAHEGGPNDKVEFGFLLATCRMPTEIELQRLLTLTQEVPETQSPWMPVAAVLLNLDEVLSK